MYKVVSKQYYSNCLFESLKQKIKHPFTTKITFVPRSEVGCFHFLWSDGVYDYDFGTERHLKGLNVLLFRGCVRRRELGFNNDYKQRMKERWER